MEDPRLEAEGWEAFKEKKDFDEGGIQGWAGGLLDDQKPLECLYKKHPLEEKEVVIIKIGSKIVIVNRKVPDGFLYAAMQVILDAAAEELQNESTGIQGEAPDGVG